MKTTRSGENTPFGGVGTHHFDSLNAIVKSILSILCDQGVVANLSPEARAASLTQLRFGLALDLSRPVLQDESRNASGRQPLRDLVRICG
jgi:hypothetical protein